MAELSGFAPTRRAQVPSVRVGALAERQWGVVKREQLEACGLSGTAISRWVRAGRLHRLHPGVYAVGHRALGTEGRFTAALFYAGPGSMLSHPTAAWWWELITEPGRRIHLNAPGYRASRREICLHHPRLTERVWHRGFPLTTVARTLLDIAGIVPFNVLRRALAEAEYRRLVDMDALTAVLGRGQRGSAALRAAIEAHRPELALTRSVLEERFIELCEREGIALPEVNVNIEGFLVDALWRERRLVVELDGGAAHDTPMAMERDRRRDLALRAAGFMTLRYTWRQVTTQPKEVAADLKRALG